MWSTVIETVRVPNTLAVSFFVEARGQRDAVPGAGFNDSFASSTHRIGAGDRACDGTYEPANDACRRCYSTVGFFGVCGR